MCPENKKNVYIHEIDLIPLNIKNQSREDFRAALEQIKYRGYEVEQLSDGRKIVITKPGGKFTRGSIKRDDILVWIYDPKNQSLWLISHKDIYGDLVEKGKVSPKNTIEIIDALERVYGGEEPDDVLKIALINPCGEIPEALFKVYKWIWGQEDCNYPPPRFEGRAMCMKDILKLREQLQGEAR